MLEFNQKQLEKLSELFMDLAKGLFLAAFAASWVRETELLILLEYYVSGILCTYFSLKLLEIKIGVNK